MGWKNMVGGKIAGEIMALVINTNSIVHSPIRLMH